MTQHSEEVQAVQMVHVVVVFDTFHPSKTQVRVFSKYEDAEIFAIGYHGLLFTRAIEESGESEESEEVGIIVFNLNEDEPEQVFDALFKILGE